jgi:DeoR/GlpR family transcriptional regulator of sugar metabolism
MLAQQRQARILAELARRGGVRVVDLCEMFGVSDMTVRRDLDVLQSQGLVEKVHGGAVLIGRRAEEPGFEAKRQREQAEKQAIARMAARLAQRGNAVGISAGTTTWYLVEPLSEVLDLTVVTNSTNIAIEMHHLARPGTRIILTGGDFRTPSDALVGPVADRAIRSMNLDLLFLGVHGMELKAGFTTPNQAEAETNRAFIVQSRRVAVLADHTKWRTVGLHTIGPLSAADVLVTDTQLETAARKALAREVGELMIAPVSRSATALPSLAEPRPGA